MLEREEVLKLAKLSRLEVAEEDIESVKGHLVPCSETYRRLLPAYLRYYFLSNKD